ncbi:MAG: tagaturonate reductase [Gemmatimonadaceae bacterium]|nr:tagaturonate reductase [Gemmatimonadaceae bacterium]
MALPRLTKALVRDGAARGGVLLPSSTMLELPERVVQFGTGAFLRGFVEYFVDEANRKGMFGGRIVAVGSTGSGRDARINDQDGLYTLVARGVADGERREERRVVASLSRALSAQSEWDEVLALARSADLRLVVSNTTEVGIVLDESDAAESSPPRSFPGKLARFLVERGRSFGHATGAGIVVIPCELIERNGARLREIVLAHTRRWGLDESARWIEQSVTFCDTLVDRIVPGAPTAEDASALRGALGYDDAMLTTAESYRLFAIERPKTARGAAALDALGVTRADAGIIVADDIAPYRERKVRLLNGTHTITVPLALLHGCETVREAVAHEAVGRFVRRVLFDEIAPSTEAPGVEAFAREVLDRFANPSIRHALIDITLQGTMKMRVRIVPLIERYAARGGRAPASLAFGFAAYLLFMRGDVQEARRAAGERVPADDHAEALRALWERHGDATDAPIARLVDVVCGDESLWGTDLRRVAGFAAAVTDALTRMVHDGIPAALEAHLAEATV